MALTTAQLVTQLYVGFYNRAPDPEGLNYWIGRVNAGVSLADIANSFAASPEAISTYPYLALPNVVSPESFLNSIYMNLFGRPIDTGAGSGLEYYSAMLASGVRPGEVLAKIQLNANTNEGTADQAYLANKVAVGLDWAEAAANTQGFVYNDAAAGSANAILSGVTDDPSTVTAAEAQIDLFFNTFGLPTFDLTVGTDTLVGTTNDDVFSAKLGLNPTDLTPVQTLQFVDTITGGAGNDTLIAELLNNAAGLVGPTLNGVENIQLTAYAGAQLSLQRATGVEVVRNVGSLADLSVTNVNYAVDLEVINVNGSNTNLSYAGVAVAEQNVSLNTVSGNVNITGVSGQIGTLNLAVVGGVGVFLDNDAASAENLVISGSGELSISGNNSFGGLVDLDASGYTGDLSIDVSGSTDLTNVLTGEGDDLVYVDANTTDADLSVDLGDGENTLFIVNVANGADITGLDFSNVVNVQTLAFGYVNTNGVSAVLDLSGFATLPENVQFSDLYNNGGDDFSIVGAGADFTLTILDELEILNGDLIVDGVVNLTIDTKWDAFVDGIQSTTLETLVVNSVDDAEIELSTGLDALVSIDINAGTEDGSSPNGRLDIDVSADTTQLAALTTINLSSLDEAELDLQGVIAVPSVQQVETLTFGTSTVAGSVRVNVPGVGIIVVPVSNTDTGIQIAANVAASLGGLTGYSVVANNNVVTVTSNTAGDMADLAVTTTGTDATAAAAVTTNGVDSIGGDGLAALEDVNVDAAGDANVDIEGIYGAFDLNVTAGDDAFVDLNGVGATAVTVTVGSEVTYVDPLNPVLLNSYDQAVINIEDAADLETITVTGAGVDLELDGDLGSLTTVDLSAVTAVVILDASGADFGATVTYSIGATSNTDAGVFDVTVFAEVAGATREVFDFVGDDIGQVQVWNFEASAQADRDALDLSGFGINASSNLTFTAAGNDLTITAADGQFDGSIQLIGVLAGGYTVNDFATNNILYA